MKILLYIVIGFVVLVGIRFVMLSVNSRKQPETGLVNAQLRACPATPNCVCSESQVDGSFIDPLSYTTTMDEALSNIKGTIARTGGVIVSESGGYLHARYETPLMRYIDDVELRIDESNHLIHVRSASRVGQSDFGANRKRVEKIRELFRLR